MAGKNEKMKQKVVYYYDESDDENEGSDFSEIAIEKLNMGPKKKLLVLGLGGLLCHRVCRKNWFDVPKHCSPDASFGSIFGMLSIANLMSFKVQSIMKKNTNMIVHFFQFTRGLTVKSLLTFAWIVLTLGYGLLLKSNLLQIILFFLYLFVTYRNWLINNLFIHVFD